MFIYYFIYPYILSTEFGAEIWIGKIKEGANDHAIKIKGYFGIDPNKPSDNYVYASISAFTLDSVYKAFELGKPNVPKCVRESGFPEGVTVAYSLEGKYFAQASWVNLCYMLFFIYFLVYLFVYLFF